MSYYQIENLAYEAIMNGAESQDSVIAYILTAVKVPYSDARAAAYNAFRKMFGQD